VLEEFVVSTARFSGYDLIGDVHGCAVSLVLLLDRLGYRLQKGVYRHPTRQAIFLGDLVDRGPRIRESLHIVRDMVEAGSAQIVMGNHEYNYLCYCTPSPEGFAHPWLREHNTRHHRILEQTLDQLANHPQDQRDFLKWFLDMPLFLEFDHFRVVHACWHQALIDQFVLQQKSNHIDTDFLIRSAVEGTFEWTVMDRLLRGTHLRLPNGEVMISGDGYRRHFFRTRFWVKEPQFMGDVVFQPDPLPEHLARTRLTTENRADLVCYDESEKLLFIGHYWCEGKPEPLAQNIACLDYSAVKYGKLVAYRLDDEPAIQADKFVWVDVEKEVTQIRECNSEREG